MKILDLSRIKIFDYLKVLNCLDSNMPVLSLSCLEFQDFVSVLNCLVLRNSCLNPSLAFTQLALDLSLLALESKPLALGIFARVPLFPTQVDLEIGLETLILFSSLLGLGSTQLALDLS